MTKIIPALTFVFLAAGAASALDVPLDQKQSSLKFTGHAFLHDFNGEAPQFSGSAQLDAGQSAIVLGARIDIQAARMTTFESARDRTMLGWLHVDTNPEMRFQLTKVKPVKGDPAGATRNHPSVFLVAGDFTLNKTTKPLETQAQGWREGGWLVVTGTTKINTADYGLPEIRQFFMTVEKQVDVAFRLVFDLPPELQIHPSH